jgi:hypothetical protein
MPNMKKSKSTDKMPARKMPEGAKFPKNNKAVPNPPGVQRTPTSGTKKPAKMTPQDAAMLKILKKKYGADVYKG